MHLNRDIINLKSQLEEQERDTDELLKKYQNHIQTNSLDSHHAERENSFAGGEN